VKVYRLKPYVSQPFQTNLFFLVDRRRVSAQPNEGYLEAIDWILHSDFNFQRRGGGMGVVAIFSSVLYVTYSVKN